mgnify:CR=1 FL=1
MIEYRYEWDGSTREGCFCCTACSPSVLRTLFGKQKPRAEARGVMIPF